MYNMDTKVIDGQMVIKRDASASEAEFSKNRLNLRVTGLVELMIDDLVAAGKELKWSPLFNMTKTAVIYKSIMEAHHKYVKVIGTKDAWPDEEPVKTTVAQTRTRKKPGRKPKKAPDNFL